MEELLKFYEAMMKLRFGTGFSAWIITIACNNCGYTGKHDEYEVSYSLKPGQIVYSADKNSGIVLNTNTTPFLN